MGPIFLPVIQQFRCKACTYRLGFDCIFIVRAIMDLFELAHKFRAVHGPLRSQPHMSLLCRAPLVLAWRGSSTVSLRISPLCRLAAAPNKLESAGHVESVRRASSCHSATQIMS